MPYDDPESSDPQMLVGVALPGTDDTVREMAAVFADEFARLGHSAEEILALFRAPFYAAAHRAFTLLGLAAVRNIIDASVARWPAVRIVDAPMKEEGP